MPFLRQSTAQTVRFGPFLDITDGVTEEVALTITQALMRLSKDGAAFAQKAAAGNATHDSDGWYSTSLDATDTDTVGELIMNVQIPATALPVWMRWWVLEEAVYDAMYGASAAGPLQSTVAGRTLDVTATGEAGLDLDNTVGTIAAGQFAAGAITATVMAAGSIDASALSTSAVDEIRDAIVSQLGVPQRNQAFSNFTFLMVLTSDHVTPAIGLTVTGQRSLDAGGLTGVAGTITEISDGLYQFDALAADMDGATVAWRFSAGTADDRFVEFTTRP